MSKGTIYHATALTAVLYCTATAGQAFLLSRGYNAGRSFPRSSLRSSPPKFGTQSYWESFYKGTSEDSNSEDSKEFEWFSSYEDLQPFFRIFAEPILADAATTGQQPKLLVAGCGNSRLSCDLYDDFLQEEQPAFQLWNVDFAEAAILRSEEMAAGRRMHHAVADLCDLSADMFPDGSFDMVLDKGALDAIFCTGATAVAAAVGELRRVLREGGLVILVSGVPAAKDVLDAFSDWDVLADGSPYITDDGEATINLRAHFYVFRKS